MILINLLPHREAARKRRREMFYGALGASAVGGLLIAGMVWLWWLLRFLVGLPSRGAAKAPTRAPEATAATTSTPAAKRQQLWCEPGGHSWSRPAVPGRKPHGCPEHA